MYMQCALREQLVCGKEGMSEYNKCVQTRVSIIRNSTLKKRDIILRHAIVGLAVILLFSCSGKKGEGEDNADGKSEIVTVEKGDIRVIVEATGSVVLGSGS